ncbi:M23 family metallopeptidase [Agromyces sp. C10]|uniref:M23 family metallopeptidase n=1 Tax=Agromyces sp. C10 TaxID=2935077 RepID=UPI00200A1B43|nr:M23 family metallopeptidase [Agromyces sp. C10]MCK8608354.1 M23 family metallopeptidase [Agromyces sp. C10]
MRPLQPPAPRVIPADPPRRDERPAAPRQERPRDLRAESTDDLSAVLAAAANTGRAPEGLEFREFDVEPPRERRPAAAPAPARPAPGARGPRHEPAPAARPSASARPAAAPAADGRPAADVAPTARPSRPAEGRGPAEAPVAPARGPRDDRALDRRVAPRSAEPARTGGGEAQPSASDARRPDVPARSDAPRDVTEPAPRRSAAAPAAASRPAPRPAGRPAPRRTLRRAITTRVASLVAMSFVALLAVATSVPSLSLLSPADVQAMALGDTTVVTLDGQRVDITGGATAAAVGREGYQAQTIEEYARAAGIRPEATFTNNPLGTIQWPFAVGVHIGDRFGYRNCAGCSTNHRGQDFNPGDGAEIQAIADGVVSVSTDAGGSLGAVTMIDHVIDGQTVTSVYAHMQYGTRRFEVGDRVEVGDVVGNTGNTGMSTGPHLHFEIRIGGVGGTHVDPLEWLWANTN